jgi:putative endonuclease
MSFTVYILHSIKLNKFYIGQTIDLSERLVLHNTKYFRDSFTAKTDDWTLVFTLNCESREQALSIEKYIKRMKSRKYIENLVRKPGYSQKLLQKFRGSLGQSRSW